MDLSDKIVKSNDLCPNDPHLLDYMSTEGLGLDYATVDFVANFPPNIVKDKPYASNEGYLNEYCRFS